jgi:hypothetical protein
MLFALANGRNIRYYNTLLEDIDKALKDMNKYPILKVSLWIRDSSFLFLLISNIVVSLMVIMNNSSLADLFAAYTLQVIIIAFFAVLNLFILKKFTVNGKNLSSKERLLTTLSFSAILLGIPFSISIIPFYNANKEVLIFSGAFFFVSHLISFLINNKFLAKHDVSSVQKYVLVRILSIYLILALFALIGFFGAKNNLLLITFIVVKTLIDLNGHVIKHNNI